MAKKKAPLRAMLARAHKPKPKASINRPRARKPVPKKAPVKKAAPKIRPPAGAYDPALDAALRASGRGLGDLRFDTDTQRERGGSDYVTALGDVARQKAELGQDIATQQGALEQGYQRNLADLLQQRGYTQQDYRSAVDTLHRNYTTLGSTQAQAGNQRGLFGGGFAAQAARKRGINQSIERAPMDTSFQRAMSASTTQQGRLGQDRQSALNSLLLQRQRGTDALDRQGGQISQGYQRSDQDLTTQLTRAQREHGAFGLDTLNQKVFQAIQGGWRPPAPPKTKKAKPRVTARRVGRGKVGAGAGRF